jgi:HlyD family secretion protein
MALQDRLFRSNALARLSSPEGLDTVMEVTSPSGWLALLGFALVVAGALVWGFLGRVPQVVQGQGLMVRQGGVFRVQSAAAGRIDSVLVEPGSRVTRGMTIAVLAQTELRTTIHQLEASLDGLEKNRASTERLLSSDRALELETIRQQRLQADEAIEAATRRIAYLDTRIANEARAVEQKILTQEAAQATIAERAQVKSQLMGASARKQELSARDVQSQVASNQTVFSLTREINQSRNRLDQLNAQLAAAANVTSPYDGLVVERLTDAGQSIGAGAAIVTIEPLNVPHQVLMFIPLEGKRIAPGMSVEMVPGGVRPEETGYFIGTVEKVSSAPLSGGALDRYLKNEVLVDQFTSQGGAYLVEVAVETDPQTGRPTKWTSRYGAPITFGSGTLVSGKIVVERTRPVALVIPAIRKWLGG